ncbi:MAG: hypothetical protein LBM75_00850 [Myxococcales bacterium]|nr:hypothetical protein [Myxococcales bacterium]
MELDQAQTDALRQTSLRLFWHEAHEEAQGHLGKIQLSWRVAGERPFDIPELLPTAPIRLEESGARLSAYPRGALVHLSQTEAPKVAPARLWMSLDSSERQGPRAPLQSDRAFERLRLAP